MKEENSPSAQTALRRRFFIRTAVLSLVSLLGALIWAIQSAPSPSAPQAWSIFLGTSAAVVSALCSALMLSRASAGKFIGAPENMVIAAVGIGAVVRIIFLAAALFAAARLFQGRGSILAAGLTFIALFGVFRVSEILFVRTAGETEGAASSVDSAVGSP